MDIKTAINQIINGHNLSHSDMHDVMKTIMQGNATSAQIGAFLVGLRLKGESIDEITAAAKVMRELGEKLHCNQRYLVDTCGTGGDSINTFNISTTSAFVVAASGARVAKHGNRSVSSKSGSADLLEAAGINIELNAEQVEDCIDNIGIGFMFAPIYHSSMKHAIGPRRELGIRTLFNILGPLTNPAGVLNQVIGVFSNDWCKPLAEVSKQLGSRHVLIVHAQDGMDEISLSGKTNITELKNGQIMHYQIIPSDFGIQIQDIKQLTVNNVNQSLNMMHTVLDNTDGALKEIVCLNAGAAIYAAGVTHSIKDGVDKAVEAIESGAAKQKLEQLIQYSQSFKS